MRTRRRLAQRAGAAACIDCGRWLAGVPAGIRKNLGEALAWPATASRWSSIPSRRQGHQLRSGITSARSGGCQGEGCLSQAITCRAGDEFVTSEFPGAIVARPSPRIPPMDELTPRERQVVDLVAAGCTSKMIGRELGISHRTVEIYRGNAMAKLGVDNVASLVRIALLRELLYEPAA